MLALLLLRTFRRRRSAATLAAVLAEAIGVHAPCPAAVERATEKIRTGRYAIRSRCLRGVRMLGAEMAKEVSLVGATVVQTAGTDDRRFDSSRRTGACPIACHGLCPTRWRDIIGVADEHGTRE
jgi:hypothetical protein